MIHSRVKILVRAILTLSVILSTPAFAGFRPNSVCENMLGTRQWIFSLPVQHLAAPYLKMADEATTAEKNEIFARVDQFLQAEKQQLPVFSTAARQVGNNPPASQKLRAAKEIYDGLRPVGWVDGKYPYNRDLSEVKAFSVRGAVEIEKILDGAGAEAIRDRKLEHRGITFLKRLTIGNIPMIATLLAAAFIPSEMDQIAFFISAPVSMFGTARAMLQVEFDRSTDTETLAMRKIQRFISGEEKLGPGQFLLIERSVGMRSNIFLMLSEDVQGELILDVIWRAEQEASEY